MTRQIRLSRAELLSRGARGGVALVAAGSAFGVLASAASADVLPDNDLAYLRLLIGAELLGADFYGKAIDAQPYATLGQGDLKRALANESDHYAALAKLVADSGQTPATAADIDFVYPSGAFASVGAVTKLAVDLETLFLGAYLGAVAGVQSASLTQLLARIAANQAQHLAVFDELLGRKGFRASLPSPLPIDEASGGLAVYTG